MPLLEKLQIPYAKRESQIAFATREVAYGICNSIVAYNICDFLNCAKFLNIFLLMLFYKLISFTCVKLPKHFRISLASLAKI
jgi:hypothetical protein